MPVKKVTLFVASDNSQHATKKLAEHHDQSLLLNKKVKDFFEARIGDLSSEQFKGVDRACAVLIKDRDTLVALLTSKPKSKSKPKAAPNEKAKAPSKAQG